LARRGFCNPRRRGLHRCAAVVGAHRRDLIGISTPYRKLGLLWQKHRDHFGIDGDDVLVVQGPALAFNSTLDVAAIAAARAADPIAAHAEWDAEFRADLDAYLDDETLERAIDHDRPLELSPQEGVCYEAFVDANAGGADAYAIAIAHKVGDDYIIDAVRGISKGDPQIVTKEYAELCRAYRIARVTGDNFSKDWVAGAWRALGFEYLQSRKVKAEIYLECVPLWRRGVVHMANVPALVRELRLLERQTHRSGKDTVNHPRNEHDDLANVVCGVLWRLAALAMQPEVPIVMTPAFPRSSLGPMPGDTGDSWSNNNRY
jgi:hypothetical protein